MGCHIVVFLFLFLSYTTYVLFGHLLKHYFLTGFQLKIDGYTDKLSVLLEKIITTLTTFTPNEQRVAIYRERVRLFTNPWCYDTKCYSVLENNIYSDMRLSGFQYPLLVNAGHSSKSSLVSRKHSLLNGRSWVWELSVEGIFRNILSAAPLSGFC